MTKKHLLAIIFLLFLCGLIWFGPQLAPAKKFEVSYIPATINIVNGDDSQSLSVEVAANTFAWQKGMMHRKEWGDIQGMLFVFREEETRNFWMKNTYLPLDIIFFDGQGNVTRIAKNAAPLSQELIPSLLPAKYVLEIPAGDAAARAIDNTSTLDVKPLRIFEP